MFDLLRKKITRFAEKVIGKNELEGEKIITRSIETEQKEEKQKEMIIPKSEIIETKKEEISTTDYPQKNEAKPILPEIQQKDEREIKASVGITQKVSRFFTGTITLQPETVNSFLEEFELSLLEADVEMNTATALMEELRKRLTHKTISAKENPTGAILSEIKNSLREILPQKEIRLDEWMVGHKPFVILILGPNGAGKTTSIAKLTYYLQKQNKKVVLASADTFRAGSIEQLQVHANKLQVRMVKHQYNADPAAVAFDAVKAAQAENADVVIIDTAGRQDTNKNLLEELKKIKRVVQPHLKLYVGESYTGQVILTQARTFDEAIGIDGFILTKLDADTKGGGVISILYTLQKPIVFFGTGQGIEDLTPFSMDAFLDRLIPEK